MYKYEYMHVFVFVSPISRNIYLAPGKVAGVIMCWSLLNVFSHHVFPLPGQCGHLCLYLYLQISNNSTQVSGRPNQTLTTNNHSNSNLDSLLGLPNSISPDFMPFHVLISYFSWFPTLAHFNFTCTCFSLAVVDIIIHQQPIFTPQ